MLALVANQEELHQIAHDPLRGKLLFVIKEAVYKCCFPLLGERWDFSDVTVRVEPGGRFESATPAQTVSGRYALSEGWILAGAVLRDPQATPRSASSALR